MPVYEMGIEIRINEKENMEKIRDYLKAYMKDLKDKNMIQRAVWRIMEEVSAELYSESGEV